MVLWLTLGLDHIGYWVSQQGFGIACIGPARLGLPAWVRQSPYFQPINLIYKPSFHISVFFPSVFKIRKYLIQTISLFHYIKYPFLWMSLIPVPTIQTFMLSFLCRYDDNAASDRRTRPPEDREGWQINKPSYGARSSRKGRTSSFALAYHKKKKKILLCKKTFEIRNIDPIHQKG